MELVRCDYGKSDGSLGGECCLRSDGQEQAYRRCPVFDWEECPFGRKVKGCGTCANAVAMTLDGDARLVDCGANELQMYSPYAAECKRWERALG